MKTKKEYEELVEIIRKFIIFNGLDCGSKNTFVEIVNNIADDLQRRNTNFKRDKFLNAIFK